jgi:hypothetical protein
MENINDVFKKFSETLDQVCELVRCGVFIDESTNGLSMFIFRT